jgi:hypothetical protein
VVVSPVVRLFSLSTLAVNSADVDDETMAAIGQGVVAEAKFFFRVKPVREGERRSRRKLGLAPEFKAEDLPVRTRRPRVLVQAPEPVPVNIQLMTSETDTDFLTRNNGSCHTQYSKVLTNVIMIFL